MTQTDNQTDAKTDGRPLLRVGHTVMLASDEKLLIRRAALEGGYRSGSEFMRRASVSAAQRVLGDLQQGREWASKNLR